MKDIHRGNFLHKGEKTYSFKGLAWIYNCPHCEYVRCAHTDEAIVSIRNLHLSTSHPDHHIPTMLVDANERVDHEFEELTKRVLKIEVD